jgi:hypothetical protein
MMMRLPSCRISISVPIPQAAKKAAGISTPREFPTLRKVVCIFFTSLSRYNKVITRQRKKQYYFRLAT